MTAARRLAAILAADVVGYSRLKGEDEAGTAKALERARLCPILESPVYVDSGRSTRRGQILRASLSLLGDKGLD